MGVAVGRNGDPPAVAVIRRRYTEPHPYHAICRSESARALPYLPSVAAVSNLPLPVAKIVSGYGWSPEHLEELVSATQVGSGRAENMQTLGQTVILSCSNLVESFISGLARAHVMETPGLHDVAAKKLVDTHEPLRKRVIAIPKTIVGGEVPLDINRGPMQSERGQPRTLCSMTYRGPWWSDR